MSDPDTEAQLASLQILKPVFEAPWPEKCSPDVEEIESRMIDWAEKYGLFPDTPGYLERVKRTRYAWLASRCYPNADKELLQVIANYFVWYFLVDDLFIDRVEVVTGDTIRNLTAAIDVLDFGQASPEPVYGELAWLDICDNLRRLLPRASFDRFAQGMRLWATTAALQMHNHMQTKPVGVRQYETIRRHTSGMNPCIALVDCANRGPVTSEEYHRPDVQALCRHTNNVVCWSNDVQSLVVEIRQPGQFWSMVGSHAASGHTLQESVDYTIERVRAEVSEFQRLSDEILPSANNPLRGLVEGCAHWMRGYMDWVMKDTKRYAVETAASDADDRRVLVS